MVSDQRRVELTFSEVMGKFTTLMSRKRQVDFEAFLADHPVFALRELATARGAPEDETAARNQLKHHVRTGRVRQVARGIYSAVPPGLEPGAFQPDRYLVAAAAKPDGVFAYHAALELHGVAQSVWQECALHCERPRTTIAVGGVEIVFLPVPEPLRREGAESLGVGTIVHSTRRLRITGPERTLVEGFRQPHRVGGLPELLESATGFALLDFAVLEKVLTAYDQRSLWAAVGWFVERNRERWLPPEQLLARCRRNRPRSMQYLVRDRRGGTGLPEWNLILPPELAAELERDAVDA